MAKAEGQGVQPSPHGTYCSAKYKCTKLHGCRQNNVVTGGEGLCIEPNIPLGLDSTPYKLNMVAPLCTDPPRITFARPPANTPIFWSTKKI